MHKYTILSKFNFQMLIKNMKILRSTFFFHNPIIPTNVTAFITLLNLYYECKNMKNF